MCIEPLRKQLGQAGRHSETGGSGRLAGYQVRHSGTKIRFGFDGLLGLIPGLGDTVTLVSTAYLVGAAAQLGLPVHQLFLMAWNGFLDWFIGLIPVIGDLLDIGFKANRRNVDLIRTYLYKHEDEGVIEGEIVEKEIS